MSYVIPTSRIEHAWIPFDTGNALIQFDISNPTGQCQMCHTRPAAGYLTYVGFLCEDHATIALLGRLIGVNP